MAAWQRNPATEHGVIVLSNAQHGGTSFLDLPREIRDMIYEFCLHQNFAEEGSISIAVQNVIDIRFRFSHAFSSLALLSTCHQVLNEYTTALFDRGSLMIRIALRAVMRNSSFLFDIQPNLARFLARAKHCELGISLNWHSNNHDMANGWWIAHIPFVLRLIRSAPFLRGLTIHWTVWPSRVSTAHRRETWRKLWTLTAMPELQRMLISVRGTGTPNKMRFERGTASQYGCLAILPTGKGR